MQRAVQQAGAEDILDTAYNKAKRVDNFDLPPEAPIQAPSYQIFTSKGEEIFEQPMKHSSIPLLSSKTPDMHTSIISYQPIRIISKKTAGLK